MRINWAAARDAYVTGNESYASVAARLKVRRQLVTRHATNKAANGGQTWAELRTAHRAALSEKTQRKTLERGSDAIAIVREKATTVARLALEELERRLGPGAAGVAVRDLVNAAKLATAVKIELGGNPDGVPIGIAAKLDELGVDELRKLAGGT